jgi:S1-C subfamily serine protease
MRAVLALLLATLAACAHAPATITAEPSAAHWMLHAEGRFIGSATAIAPDRLLTNRHVVGARTAMRATAPDGAAHGVRVLAVGRDVDVALLALDAATASPALPRAHGPSPGEPLSVSGAIGGQRQSGHGRTLAPQANGLRAAMLPVAPGYSGGPVLDGEGRLVGIVVAAAAGSLAEARQLAATRAGEPLGERLVLIIPPATAMAALGEPAMSPPSR